MQPHALLLVLGAIGATFFIGTIMARVAAAFEYRHLTMSVSAIGSVIMTLISTLFYMIGYVGMMELLLHLAVGIPLDPQALVEYLEDHTGSGLIMTRASPLILGLITALAVTYWFKRRVKT